MEQENSLIPEEEIKNPEILETSTNDEPVVAESKAVENAKEKKEVPEIDFSILSTEEIIRQAQKLINDYPVVSLKEIFEGLPEIFESRYKEEYEKALAIFTADGDKPEDFEYKNDNRERFNALYKLYKDKKNATARQTEAEREENLKIKLGIIEELKALDNVKTATINDADENFDYIPGIPGLTGTLAEYRNGTSRAIKRPVGDLSPSR